MRWISVREIWHWSMKTDSELLLDLSLEFRVGRQVEDVAYVF